MILWVGATFVRIVFEAFVGLDQHVLGREQEICAKKQARIGSDASEMTIEQGPGVCEVNAPGASTAALVGMRSHDLGCLLRSYYRIQSESKKIRDPEAAGGFQRTTTRSKKGRQSGITPLCIAMPLERCRINDSD